MKVKDLVKHLKECPQDYDVNLTGYVVYNDEDLPEINEGEVSGAPYSVALCSPIWGLAENTDSKEIRFVIGQSSIEAIQTIENMVTEIDAIGKKGKLSSS